MLCVGLTGGIGVGKTLASDLFAALGADVVDTDVIARALLSVDGPLYQAVVDHFGPGIVREDRAIDRRLLRQLIFNHPHEKKWLESIIHPMIRAEAKAAVESSPGPYVIIVIPLLSQANLKDYPFLDRICVVETSKELQIVRTMERDKISRDNAEKIIAHQIPSHERLTLAHDVLENNGDRENFNAAVRQLHEQYLHFNAQSS